MFLLILICVLLIVLYYYGTINHDYWKKKGVIFEKPLIFVGSNLQFLFEGVSFTERFVNLYKRYPNEKYVGFFQGNNPVLFIKDPELIRQVFISDFRFFYNRGLAPHKEITEPLMKNLFVVDGDMWKPLRQKLTPAFTTGKLRAMFPMIVNRAEKLVSIIDNLHDTQEEIDVREVIARYTTEFIGVCGFGINSESLQDETCEFRKLGKRIFTRELRDIVIGVLKITFPTLAKHLHVLAPEIEYNTVKLVTDIMEQRNYEPSGRNDFIDFMIELKQKGNITGESMEELNADGTPAKIELEVDDELIAAQVFIFFAAGFETSSSASSFLLHMLAYYPEKQELCQREIDEVLQKYDGKLCYDAVKDMKYLEMALKESLRIQPAVGFITRKSTKEYTFPGTDLTIDEGVAVYMSAHALHTDEKYFDNPEEFRPERFSPENIGKIEKGVFLPFGDGPRSCIGERMGIMQSLAGVATILSKFTVAPSRSTVRKPRIDPSSAVVSTVAGGLPLSIKRR